MYQGELVEQGQPEKMLATPQHDYSQRLLANVTRLHGRYKSEHETMPE